jgi:DNA-binding NtrC family response regulator
MVKRMTSDIARAHGRRAPSYSVSARNLMKAHHWPGNIRELRNFCERMVILMAGAAVQPEDLPDEVRRGAGGKQGAFGFLLPEDGVDLQAFEADVIRQALGMSGGNRSRAARLLRISRDTLLYRIQKHALKV